MSKKTGRSSLDELQAINVTCCLQGNIVWILSLFVQVLGMWFGAVLFGHGQILLMRRVIHRVPLAFVVGPPALLPWDNTRKQHPGI